MAAGQVLEVPGDFSPAFIICDGCVRCVSPPVDLGFALTPDEAHNTRMLACLRHSAWWHMQLAQRGIEPYSRGNA